MDGTGMYLLLGVFSLAVLFCASPSDAAHSGISARHRVRRSAQWNDLADSLLNYASREIVQQGKSRVALPDVYERFSKKKGFLRLKGEFRATGGWLESFASLARVGDVTVQRVGDASVMTLVLGLNDLRLGYDRYEAEFWGHGPDGSLEGRIGKNAIRFVIKFDAADGGCATTLEDVQVVEFDDFDVKVSGLGSFDWLAEKVVEWVTDKRRGDIKDSVQRQLREQVEKALQNFECEEFAGLMIPI